MDKGWNWWSSTTRHAGVVGLWGAPPQRPPGSNPNGNYRNGGILARSKTAPLPVPPSKRMKSPSNIMRQSSLTKLGSMINTAVNKRVGEYYFFLFPFFPFPFPFLFLFCFLLLLRFCSTLSFKLVCCKCYFAFLLCHEIVLDFPSFEIGHLIRNNLLNSF